MPAEAPTLRDHYLDVFRRIGQRRARTLSEADADLGRVAVLVPSARAAGTPVDAIADALGVSKPLIYQLVKARGTEQHTRLIMLATLGARGGLTADQLAAEIGLDLETTDAQLGALHREQLVGPLMAHYGGGERSETFWRLEREGEREVRRLTDQLGEPEQRRYSVYFELNDEERVALPSIAAERLGHVRFALLGPELTRITGKIRRPELAFTVLAENFEEAAERGRELFAELQQTAGLRPRSPVLAYIADATGSL